MMAEHLLPDFIAIGFGPELLRWPHV